MSFKTNMNIAPVSQNASNSTFTARVKANALVLDGIQIYKTKKIWLNTINEISDISVLEILSGKFENALNTVVSGVKFANAQKNGENWADICINESKIKEISKNIDSVFNDLFKKHISKYPTQKDLPDINSSVGEIRWNLAHSLSKNGESETIANVFIRAIYKSMGVLAFPLKRGVSLNREANNKGLEEYKKTFPSYFEKEPRIVGLFHIA